MTWRPGKGAETPAAENTGWKDEFYLNLPCVFSGKLGLKMEIRNKQIAALHLFRVDIIPSIMFFLRVEILQSMSNMPSRYLKAIRSESLAS